MPKASWVLPLAIVYTITLVIALLINPPKVIELNFDNYDKFYHVIAYCGLAFLWFNYAKIHNLKQQLLKVFFATTLFGVILEFLQHNINPNRQFDVYDMLANSVGIVIGIIIAINLELFKVN